MQIPENIIKQYNALYDLCQLYPLKIPLEKVADFLGMDREGLRSAIDQGRCPFGLCVQKNKYSNRAFDISTIAFFSWATNGAIFRTLTVEKVMAEVTS